MRFTYVNVLPHTRIYTYIRIYAIRYLGTLVYTHSCIVKHTYRHIHAHAHAYTRYIHTHMCRYIHIFILIYVYMHLCRNINAFQRDMEQGFTSVNFDLHENIREGDERAGLVDADKVYIYIYIYIYDHA